MENVHNVYVRHKAECERRYNALDAKDKAFIDKLYAVDLGTRGAKMHEMLLIHEVTCGAASEAFILAYRYGFSKGTLAEKARKAKMQKERRIHERN